MTDRDEVVAELRPPAKYPRVVSLRMLTCMRSRTRREDLAELAQGGLSLEPPVPGQLVAATTRMMRRDLDDLQRAGFAIYIRAGRRRAQRRRDDPRLEVADGRSRTFDCGCPP